MKVKVCLVAVASKKELHEAVRRSLQRRLRAGATALAII